MLKSKKIFLPYIFLATIIIHPYIQGMEEIPPKSSYSYTKLGVGIGITSFLLWLWLKKDRQSSTIHSTPMLDPESNIIPSQDFIIRRRDFSSPINILPPNEKVGDKAHDSDHKNIRLIPATPSSYQPLLDMLKQRTKLSLHYQLKDPYYPSPPDRQLILWRPPLYFEASHDLKSSINKKPKMLMPTKKNSRPQSKIKHLETTIVKKSTTDLPPEMTATERFDTLKEGAPHLYRTLTNLKLNPEIKLDPTHIAVILEHHISHESYLQSDGTGPEGAFKTNRYNLAVKTQKKFLRNHPEVNPTKHVEIGELVWNTFHKYLIRTRVPLQEASEINFVKKMYGIK